MREGNADVGWRERRVEPRDVGLEGEVGALEEEDTGWGRENGFLVKLDGERSVGLNEEGAGEAEDAVQMGRCCY